MIGGKDVVSRAFPSSKLRATPISADRLNPCRKGDLHMCQVHQPVYPGFCAVVSDSPG